MIKRKWGDEQSSFFLFGIVVGSTTTTIFQIFAFPLDKSPKIWYNKVQEKTKEKKQMQVVDNRKPIREECFADLPLGATYIDEYGCLCIKTVNDDEYDNCLVYHADLGIWKSDQEAMHNKVTICNTTLTIEG